MDETAEGPGRSMAEKKVKEIRAETSDIGSKEREATAEPLLAEEAIGETAEGPQRSMAEKVEEIGAVTGNIGTGERGATTEPSLATDLLLGICSVISPPSGCL